LLFAYSQREDWRAQIKQILFRLFTISLPVLIIGALELGIKTWERMYVETYSSPEDMSAEQTIFRLALDEMLYGQNASPQGVSPYRRSNRTIIISTATVCGPIKWGPRPIRAAGGRLAC